MTDTLYHGTNEPGWQSILAAGAILPRNMHGASNWNHTIKSHYGAVYLTDTYAPYFAINAITTDEFSDDGPIVRAAIIEIDATAILAGLTADEDALEQSTRVPGKRMSKMTMNQRTIKARAMLPRLAGSGAWGESLAFMGTCAHIGPIPFAAIRRVALVPISGSIDHSSWAIQAMQPSITRANYQYCGADYRKHLADGFALPDTTIWMP